MQAIDAVPKFSIRWTEPLGFARTRQHELAVDVRGESGTSPLVGTVTARTDDSLGPIPAGMSRAETRVLRDADAIGAVGALWKQVKRDRVEQWIPRAEGDPGRMDREDVELVVSRGDRQEVFRTDLRSAAKPIQDLIASAAHLHADVRLNPWR